MKSVTFFAVFLICVHLSLQIPRLINCRPNVVLPESYPTCIGVTCQESGRPMVLECGLVSCPKGGLKGSDNSKVYPDCCYSCGN